MHEDIEEMFDDTNGVGELALSNGWVGTVELGIGYNITLVNKNSATERAVVRAYFGDAEHGKAFVASIVGIKVVADD